MIIFLLCRFIFIFKLKTCFKTISFERDPELLPHPGPPRKLERITSLRADITDLRSRGWRILNRSKPHKEMYPREVRWASQDSLSDACNMTDGNRARNDSLHTIVNPLESYCETDVDKFAPRLNVAVSSRHLRQPPSWTCACGNGAWSHPSSSCAWPNAGTGGTTSSCHPSWRTPFCARNVSSAPWLLGTTGAWRVTTSNYEERRQQITSMNPKQLRLAKNTHMIFEYFPVLPGD